MAKYRMKDYRGWNHDERMAFCKLTDDAIAKGELPPLHEVGCNRCGQKEGLMSYHSPWYASIKCCEPLCWRCHIITHCERWKPEVCEAYWREIKAGKQYPPVYKHNFGILRRDHGF